MLEFLAINYFLQKSSIIDVSWRPIYTFLTSFTVDFEQVFKLLSTSLVTYLQVDTQPANLCSKLTTETLGQGVKYIQS